MHSSFLNFELVPFASGRKSCTGISLALQVLQLTLASLLHSFEVATPSNEAVDMIESPGMTNLKASPLEVFITPRLDSKLHAPLVKRNFEVQGLPLCVF
ncbi:Cytochrome P450 [Melia azedarach]|uniref:Cytochrome P450 n=1 Tax=Melia azedarach TaxID=155640 RepID=A0ACC1XVP9_MELAZ|nr:Cytochrome P450 [Melia azedarach]